MIGRKRQLSDRDLAALADGSLPASRRPRVERAVAASPQLQADLSAQRRALAALAEAADERAPSALRARLELARDPRPRRALPRRGWTAIPVAAVAAAAAIVLTVGSGPGAPTVAAAATLAFRAPLHPAGGVAANSDTLTWPTAGGLAFPDWRREYGFNATGARTDRLGDRVAATVFYNQGGARIAYTIVSGHALAAGAPASESMVGGTRMWSYTSKGRAIVTWLRGGHTCVLSGAPALLSELQRLAASKPHSVPVV
jgi:anti-sigma factor RsiW